MLESKADRNNQDLLWYVEKDGQTEVGVNAVSEYQIKIQDKTREDQDKVGSGGRARGGRAQLKGDWSIRWVDVLESRSRRRGLKESNIRMQMKQKASKGLKGKSWGRSLVCSCSFFRRYWEWRRASCKYKSYGVITLLKAGAKRYWKYGQGLN